MKNRMKKTVINIVTLVLMFLGMVQVFQMNETIWKTTAGLANISSQITKYNAAHVKTNEMTAQMYDIFAERQNDYYESDDMIVKGYSNLDSLGKLLVIGIVIASYPVCMYIVALQATKTLAIALGRTRRRARRRKQAVSNANYYQIKKAP